VVVQVTGVVAQLRDRLRDRWREAVVLLQVDDERHGRARVDLGERIGVGLAVHRDAHQRRRRRASASACATVAGTSCVCVAHMLCTEMGEPAPISTFPARTRRVGLRGVPTLTAQP
jgi:hypothetical protein